MANVGALGVASAQWLAAQLCLLAVRGLMLAHAGSERMSSVPRAGLLPLSRAGAIWEFLRSELEMDGRFKTLESKLNLIQDNLKVGLSSFERCLTRCCPCCPFSCPLQYFLEILQNRKSDTLEWIIIILIGAEICLSLYDLLSKGF